MQWAVDTAISEWFYCASQHKLFCCIFSDTYNNIYEWFKVKGTSFSAQCLHVHPRARDSSSDNVKQVSVWPKDTHLPSWQSSRPVPVSVSVLCRTCVMAQVMVVMTGKVFLCVCWLQWRLVRGMGMGIQMDIVSGWQLELALLT